MLLRLLVRSFTKGWKRKALVVLSISFGASLAAAMLNISLDIGDKMNKELKSYGANLIVTPRLQALPLQTEGYSSQPSADELLDEEALAKIKTVFWRNNIVGFTPYLETTGKVNGSDKVKITGTWFNKRLVIPTGETITAGIKPVRPWWKVSGNWPRDDGEEVLVGREMAKRLGAGQTDRLKLVIAPANYPVELRVTGILDGGEEDDNGLFVPLNVVQDAMNVPKKVARIEVSALTTPDNELAKKAEADPESLTSNEFETWYCTAYVSAIAYQLEEAIPGARAKVVRQISESEGAVLTQVQILMWLLTGIALVSSALGISSLMTTSVLERREEIGLKKAIGAEDGKIVALFLGEGAIQGLIGSLIGYGAGILIAKVIGNTTFGTDISIKAFVLPVTAILSILIVWISSASAISAIIKLSPKEVLHGR